MGKDQPSLPARRAFVVQLHADARPEQGAFKGRVEHIVSREAAHFDSIEELVAFMQRTLAAREPAEAGDTPEDED